MPRLTKDEHDKQALRREFLRRVFTMSCFSHIRWRASEIFWRDSDIYAVVEKHGASCDVCGKTAYYGTLNYLKYFICHGCNIRYRDFCSRQNLPKTKHQSLIFWLAHSVRRATNKFEPSSRHSYLNHDDPQFIVDNKFKKLIARTTTKRNRRWKDGKPLGLFFCHICGHATADVDKICGHHGLYLTAISFLFWYPSPHNRDRYSRHYHKIIRLGKGDVLQIKANLEWWNSLRFSKNWPTPASDEKMIGFTLELGLRNLSPSRATGPWREQQFNLRKPRRRRRKKSCRETTIYGYDT